MKTNLKEKNTLHQTVLIANTPVSEQLLLTEILGRPLLDYQIKSLVAAAIDDLIIVIRHDADELRSLGRSLAINYPIKLQLVNDDRDDWVELLVALNTQLKPNFFLTPANNLLASFQLQEMSTWTGDVIASSQTEKLAVNYGSIASSEKLITDVSSQIIKNYSPLIGSYIIREEWLKFLLAQTPPAKGSWWHQTLAAFAPDNVVKTCQFSNEGQIDLICASAHDLLAINNYYFALAPATISAQSQLAPTCRLTGKIIIEAGAQVGEFCHLVGPLYLGHAAKVGDYCRLAGPNYLGRGAAIAPYCQLQHTVVGANVSCSPSFHTFDHKIIN